MKKPRDRFKRAVDIVCDSLVLSFDDLVSKSRKTELVKARQLLAKAILEKGFGPIEVKNLLGVSYGNVYSMANSFTNCHETSKEFKSMYGSVYQEVLESIRPKGPMIKDRVYICGQVTGIDYDVAERRFKEACDKLQRRGYRNVYNPLSSPTYQDNVKETNKTCLFRLLSCKAIYQMPNAHLCSWAGIELAVSDYIGLQLITDKDL